MRLHILCITVLITSELKKHSALSPQK